MRKLAQTALMFILCNKHKSAYLENWIYHFITPDILSTPVLKSNSDEAKNVILKSVLVNEKKDAAYGIVL